MTPSSTMVTVESLSSGERPSTFMTVGKESVNWEVGGPNLGRSPPGCQRDHRPLWARPQACRKRSRRTGQLFSEMHRAPLEYGRIACSPASDSGYGT